MSDPTSSAVNIGNTYGAYFIGLILKSILYGVSIAQTWTYFCSRECRRKDSTVIRGFIASITVLNTLHVAFSAYLLYWYLIQNFGDVENLGVDHWWVDSFWWMRPLIDLIACPGRWRFKSPSMYTLLSLIRLDNSLQITIDFFGLYDTTILCEADSYHKQQYCPCNNYCGLAVFDFGTGIVFIVREHMLKRYSRESSSIYLSYIGMGGFELLDTLIAVSMCWCLYRRRTGYGRTDTIITILMIYIISSGMLTSILGSATVISFIAAPTTLINQVFYLPFGTCYVNCLLALMNNRDLILKGSVTDNVNSDSLRPQTVPTPMIVVTVHRTATMDLEVSKQDPDMEANGALESKTLEGSSTSTIHEELSYSDA
ncbi:hypothetical protein BJV74DRAFT_83060 [Russula compacta]|nr:hypothetical protein BJV74DRAFT_83060 [Russula compacta]